MDEKREQTHSSNIQLHRPSNRGRPHLKGTKTQYEHDKERIPSRVSQRVQMVVIDKARDKATRKAVNEIAKPHPLRVARP